MGKVALIFWWVSATMPPNAGMSIGGGPDASVQVQLAGIQMRGVTLYDKAEDCTAEQTKLNEEHRNDVIVISACWIAGSGWMILGVPK